MAPAANTTVLASTKVFSIVELLEQILLDLAGQLSNLNTKNHGSHTPSKLLFVLQSVNTTFRDTIKSNTRLQEHMWLKARKNTTLDFDHIPMRWLLKYLNLTKQDLRPRREEAKKVKFMGVELRALKLDYIDRTPEVGHSLHLDRLWAKQMTWEHARAFGRSLRYALNTTNTTRPSWWKMKVFGSELALPLRIRFEVRYAGEDRPVQRYCIEWRAKWQENLILGDFVLQYLEAVQVADSGNLLACQLMDQKGEGTVPLLPLSARLREQARAGRSEGIRINREKLRAALNGAAPVI